MNPEPAGTVIGGWMPTVIFEARTGVTRDSLQAVFAAENIDARVFFHPLSSLPMIAARPGNHHAWNIPDRAINLPSFHEMTLSQQDCVVNVVRQHLRDGGKNDGFCRD
jgi:perosamine synthetase